MVKSSRSKAGSRERPAAGDDRRRRLPWYLILAGLLLLVGLYYRLQWPTLAGFVDAMDHDAEFMPDFIHHYYPMSRSILQTALPVERYYYTAFFAILLWPLGLLPLPAALAFWVAVQIAALAALAILSAQLLQLGARGAVLLTGLFLTSFPVLHNFKWGQVSVPITAAIVAAALLAGRRRQVLAGSLLGIAAAGKFYPALFALPWLARWRWRALVSFAAAAASLYVVLPALLLGPGRWAAFERATSFSLGQAGWIRYDVNSHFIAHVAARWFTIFTGREAAPSFVTAFAVAGFLVAAGLLALSWRLRPGSGRERRGLFLVPLFVALPFVLRTSWPHYFVCLPLCQAALLLEMMPAARGRRLAWPPQVLAVLSMALSSIFVFNLFPNWGTYNTCGLLFFSNLLLVPACAMAALRREAPGQAGEQAARRVGAAATEA